ncbi:MAG TPA: EAL domain-containing protein [Acidimicrobiia bacterium]
MRLRGPRALRFYVRAVTAAGLVALAVVTVLGRRAPVDHRATFFMFSALVVVGELFPIQVSIGNESQDVTTSTTFAFALLLAVGSGPAALAQSVASLVSDTVQHKPWWKRLFNVAQYTISVVAAGAVLKVLTIHHQFGHGSVSLRSLVPALLAGGTFFIVNHVLTGTGIALALDVPLRRFLLRDFGFYAATNAVILALSPVVLVCAEANLWLVPILLLPIAAAYRSAKASVEKEHQATHDALTGLPNRVGFRAAVVQSVSEEPDRPFAVLLIDLDRFKDVNDTLGHHIGDLLLQRVGERLRGALRETDLVARLGGDEFGVFAPVQDADTAAYVARVVAATLEEPVELEGLSFQVRGSIGVALHPEHGDDGDTLIQRSDVAMYLAKELQSGFQLYHADRDHHTTRRLALLSDLKSAIDGNELVLYYQPLAELATGKVVAVEALVRWEHPEHGLVPPDEFIPLAEPTGLIERLTVRVLEDALQQAASWAAKGRSLAVAVNVSVRNLYDADFALRVQELLERWNVSPSSLHLEITEGTLMADPTRAQPVLEALHRMGVLLVLDDFGTGYSSLTRLKRLPVSKVKIDKSFVQGMTGDDDDAAIVRSTVDLGRSLGLQVVAEGVESERAWLMLAELGCHIAQGYYLSRPVPAGELDAWLAARERLVPLSNTVTSIRSTT